MRRTWLSLAVIAVLACAASRAGAQPPEAAPSPVSNERTAPSESAAPAEPSPEELERARRLFRRGVLHTENKEYSSAVKRFREALAIRKTGAIEYNLASALYEIGQYDEAYNRVQSVLHDPSSGQPVRERAEKLERVLTQYVARLTVALSGREDDLGARVDGQPLASELIGVPQAVAPGTHTVVAEREGVSISERQVNIPLRTAALIDVSLIVAEARAVAVVEEPPAVVAPAPAAPDERALRNERRAKRVRLWVPVAAAVVAVAVAVGVSVALARGDSSRAEAPAPGTTNPRVVTW